MTRKESMVKISSQLEFVAVLKYHKLPSKPGNNIKRLAFQKKKKAGNLNLLRLINESRNNNFSEKQLIISITITSSDRRRKK